MRLAPSAARGAATPARDWLDTCATRPSAHHRSRPSSCGRHQPSDATACRPAPADTLSSIQAVGLRHDRLGRQATPPEPREDLPAPHGFAPKPPSHDPPAPSQSTKTQRGDYPPADITWSLAQPPDRPPRCSDFASAMKAPGSGSASTGQPCSWAWSSCHGAGSARYEPCSRPCAALIPQKQPSNGHSPERHNHACPPLAWPLCSGWSPARLCPPLMECIRCNFMT